MRIAPTIVRDCIIFARGEGTNISGFQYIITNILNELLAKLRFKVFVTVINMDKVFFCYCYIYLNSMHLYNRIVDSNIVRNEVFIVDVNSRICINYLYFRREIGF